MLRTTLLVLALAAPAFAAEPAWPGFRGTANRGTSTVTDLPDKIAPGENQRWAIDLPGRGLSCPSIMGDKLFLTANSGMDQSRLHVLAYDAISGKQLWERQFWATRETFCHPVTCMACPTIATDGKLVHALFATGDMVSLTVDGDVRWVRSLGTDFPKMVNHVGRSSSPVIAGDVVAVLMENQGESFLFGIDAATGTTRWKAPRQDKNNNWNTPLVMEQGGATVVLVQSYDGLTAYDAKTGAEKWKFADKGLSPIPSPVSVANSDSILAPGNNGLFVLKPKPDGADLLWKTNKLRSANGSPLAVDGKVYTLHNAVLACGDLADGKMLWDLRVKGKFWASPVFADGKLYLVNEKGLVTVVKPGDKGEILSEGDLGEPVYATPAVAHGAIYFRSDKHLWCFAGGKKSS